MKIAARAAQRNFNNLQLFSKEHHVLSEVASMFRTRMIGTRLLMVWAVLSCAAVLHSQTPTAQVIGRVTDSTQAVVPGVSITLTNVGSGSQWRTETNELGYYTLALLPPGEYRIELQREGFRSVSQSGITLAVNQTARIDFKLEVGAVAEVLDVVAASPVVERETVALGAVVENRSIVNLPLNGRNTLQLALLVPGVSPGSIDLTRAASNTCRRSSENEVF
jgi:hypothetical protein